MIETILCDLPTVPGLRGLILFLASHAPVIHRVDARLGDDVLPGLVRGVGQVVRRFGTRSGRVEIRYEYGRFIVQPLRPDLTVALLTNERPNLPLLALALDALRSLPAASLSAALQEAAGLSSSPAVMPTEPARPEQDRSLETKPAARLAHHRPMPLTTDPSPDAPLSSFVRPVASTAPPSPAERPSFDDETFASTTAFATPSSSPTSVTPVPAEKLAAALNLVSVLAARSLGRSIIANYWRETREPSGVLGFEMGPDNLIRPAPPAPTLNEDAQPAVRRWAQAFLARCARIMVDLPTDLIDGLDHETRTLLFPAPDATAWKGTG